MFVSIFSDAVEFYMHQKLKNGFEIRSSVKNVFVDLYLIFHCWVDFLKLIMKPLSRCIDVPA